jgi:Acetyltransferase (GNAT) family
VDTLPDERIFRLDGLTWGKCGLNCREGVEEEELVGFITARLFRLQESDSVDRALLQLDSPAMDSNTAMYILTIGVVPEYRQMGIATALLQVMFAVTVPPSFSGPEICLSHLFPNISTNILCCSIPWQPAMQSLLSPYSLFPYALPMGVCMELLACARV